MYFYGLNEIKKVLENHDIKTELFQIGNKLVYGCLACGKCRKDGKCFIDDEVNIIGSKLDEYQGIILSSPVYYAGPTGQLTAFLDRLFHCYGNKMANKLGASVVNCRRGGASAAFDRLNKYFTICNMPVVSSQYWNQTHGNTIEEMIKDEEGLQTLRTLAENMAWLLKSIEAGEKVGIAKPNHEKKKITNFIQ